VSTGLEFWSIQLLFESSLLRFRSRKYRSTASFSISRQLDCRIIVSWFAKQTLSRLYRSTAIINRNQRL